MRSQRHRTGRAYRPSIMELERLQMLDASQVTAIPFGAMAAEATPPLAVLDTSPPMSGSGSALESMVAGSALHSRPSSAGTAPGSLGLSLTAGLRLMGKLSAGPDGFRSGLFASRGGWPGVAPGLANAAPDLIREAPVSVTPASPGAATPGRGAFRPLLAPQGAVARPFGGGASVQAGDPPYSFSTDAEPPGGGGITALVVGGGTANDPWTITYTTNPDGSTSVDETISSSYGDPSAAGTDTSGIDSASVPNGGTDSLDITVTTGVGPVTVVIDADHKDSFGENGTIVGPSIGGTYSDSGSDAYHYHSSTTLNSDGTSSVTSSIHSKTSDKFDATVSGSGGNLVGFTLTVSGSDGHKDDRTTTPDGGGENHQIDTGTETLDLSGTNLDGATTTANLSETIGYVDDATPSSDTTTHTDKGGDSYGFSNSGTLPDGGSFAATDNNSDTYDDKDTAVVGIAGGVPSPTSDDATAISTQKDKLHLTISGVGEGNGSSVTDDTDGTQSSSGTDTFTRHRSPGSAIDQEHNTGTTSSSETGHDAGGPYGSGGGDTAPDVTRTVTNGTTVIDDQSPPPTPTTSYGVTPTGPINDDTMNLIQDASMAPGVALASASAAGVGQFVPTQVPAPGPAQPPPAPLLQNVTLRDLSYAEALAVGDVGKLKTIKEQYKDQIDVDEKLSRLFLDMAKNMSDKTKMEVDVGAFKFAPIILQGLRQRLARFVGMANVGETAILETLSQAYANEATRLGDSLSNIGAAIVTLTLNPPAKP